MQYDKTKNVITDRREVAGLLISNQEFEIKERRATLRFTGPKIPPEVWNQILSFFDWTWQQSHSESQVRLYVNSQAQTWRAWAFPQQANTGMSSKEINVMESPEKAAERFETWGFPPSGDWIFFGTVHHHCSATAFQSGTDENGTWNQDGEKNQDGLHITVGKMGQPKYDLHCRFYLNGDKYDPDMSWFWEIGEQARALVPDDLHDKVARFQMGRPSNVAFPGVWRDNYMEIKRDFTVGVGNGTGSGLGLSTHYDHTQKHLNLPVYEREERALDQVLDDLTISQSVDEKVVVEYLISLEQSLEEILEAAKHWKVDVASIIREARYFRNRSYTRINRHKPTSLGLPAPKVVDVPGTDPETGWPIGCMD